MHDRRFLFVEAPGCSMAMDHDYWIGVHIELRATSSATSPCRGLKRSLH